MHGPNGEKNKLTKAQEEQVVAFVKKWRHKFFCTGPYIKLELKLEASVRTIRRTLNRHGFYWRAVAKKTPLTPPQLAERKAFVTKHLNHTPGWWQEQMSLVLDGVTLTKAPQSLTGRQKHAAQAITNMWMRKGEKQDPKLHTYNRYGVQLGKKVPLWGGFTGSGTFALKLWTHKPKMVKEEWAEYIPALKRSIDQVYGVAPRGTKRKVWLDNEGFLKNPSDYKKAGLVTVRFPPNSGDLNPIETVWARLRKDLAIREFEDLKADRVITVVQFKQRAAQLLHSYGLKAPGERYSYLERLVRGMPARLAKCKNNRYGPCGK